MVKVKASSILNEAKEIKVFVEKNKVLPKQCTLNSGQTFDIYDMSFMMASVLLNARVELWNFDKGIQRYNVGRYKDKLNNVKVSNSRYMDMVSRFVSYSKKNSRVPSNIMVSGELGSASFELFTYCLAKILAFYHEKHTLPSYCIFNKGDLQVNAKTSANAKKTTTSSTSNKTKTVKKTNCENPYTSAPHYTTQGCNKLGQCTGYYCGPHSIHQALRKFGITKFSEKTLAGWCGTTTRGTDHQGINTCIAKASKETGIKLQVKWKNFSDLAPTRDKRFEELGKLMCKQNTAIITHIGYQDSGSKISSKIFGHYELLDKINTKTKYARALNSLGNKTTANAYAGHLQDRSFNVQANYFASTPGNQSALCIITKT